MNRRQFTRIAGASAVAATGLSIGRRASAQGRRKVTFLFDIGAYGKHAIFYPAVERGFFRDAGLDVQIEAAKGSADNALKVASGSAEFGFADTPTSILARGNGLKVKQVLMVHYKAMNNVITLASNPVRNPKDMVGKTFGATAGDAPRVALPALAKINGFDVSKVEIVTIEGSAKPAVLASKKADGVLGLSAFAPVYSVAAEKTGDKLVQMLFADFGLDLYSNGIIVSDDLIAKDPELVRAFNQAIVQSILYSVANRDEAVKMYLKHHPLSNPATVRAQLDVAIDHLLVDEVRANGVGPMSQSKMEFTLGIVRDFYGLKGDVKLADVYSNQFVKPGQRPTGA
ncbi:MAG TPA: ABC transporter substrate-binding protein [Burkholderiaceae bacterium]|nr:ABC transporter substrate-binding protein [Burkholderiaceae bacterium]